MTEYKWIINQLQCIPREGQLVDVVNCVHWTRYAQQDEIQGSWLDAGLDTTALDLNLDGQIENIINPPIVTPPLPFLNP